MRTPVYTRQFGRDVKRLRRRGRDFEEFRVVVRALVAGEPLDAAYREHKLVGPFKGRRECHVEPDWLLIYKVTRGSIIFERTGTHADLFRS